MVRDDMQPGRDQPQCQQREVGLTVMFIKVGTVAGDIKSQ